MRTRLPALLLAAAAGGCLYDAPGESLLAACLTDGDCGDNEWCAGIHLERGSACDSAYLYQAVRPDTGEIFTSSRPQEPTVPFFCVNGQRFYPYCVEKGSVRCGSEGCRAPATCVAQPTQLSCLDSVSMCACSDGCSWGFLRTENSQKPVTICF